MMRVLLAALLLSAGARAADLPGKAPVDPWKGFKSADVGVTEAGVPPMLVTAKKHVRAVTDDPAKTYESERRLFALDPVDAAALAAAETQKKPIEATARPTNLYLQVAKDGSSRLVAREDGMPPRELKKFAKDAVRPASVAALLGKPALAANVTEKGDPIVISAKPAGTTPIPPADVPAAKPDAGKLSEFEKTVLRPKMLKEAERATCADDAPIDKCRQLLVRVLELASNDQIAQEAYLEQRIGAADYKEYYEKARAAAADKAKDFAPWHAAIVAEFEAYRKAPSAFDPKKVKPEAGIEKLLEALKHQRKMDDRIPKSPLGQALIKILGTSHDAVNEAAVIEAYYRKAPADDKDVAAIIAASAKGPAGKAEIEAIRKNVAAKAREFLNKDPRPTDSPFSALPDDELVLDHYCGAVGHFLAGAAATQEAALEKTRAMQEGRRWQLTDGTAADNARAPVAAPDRADQRCAARRRAGPSTQQPPGGEPPPRQTDLRGFVPGPPGAAVGPDEDKSDKLNLYNGIKGAVLGAIIGGILLGPAGLLLGAAVLGFAGWYMSKDANEK
jgi:hypothetical protein